MTLLPAFKGNNKFTIGVELELQLVNLQNFNLIMEATDFLRRTEKLLLKGEVKPEITQSMLEINSSVHTSYKSLLLELNNIITILNTEAKRTHIGISGGGTHPFQKWKEQRIYQTERFASVSEQYGYLAKQFTVFGQHIHVSCENGDDALFLCHALVPYLPHFIALSASSPFNQGINTSFDCSRLAIISSFPLSGTPPMVHSWNEFEEYFNKLAHLHIVKSMKDFYWDVRPKPEYGTIEIRICDTPLTVEKAADLAAYAQMLCRYLLTNRPKILREIYLTYFVNRFRAARYGFEAVIVDPIAETHTPLAQDILFTCDNLEEHAIALDSMISLQSIKDSALNSSNGARWIKDKFKALQNLNDVMRLQTELWN